MRRVRINVLYDQLAQGLIATSVNAFVLAYILAPVSDARIAWTWFAAMLALTVLRGVLLVAHRRSDRENGPIGHWRWLFLAGVVASAGLWGVTSILMFPAESLVHQAFIGFVLAGMTAGAMGSFAASHRMFLAFMLPTCLPYIFMLLLYGSAMQTAMAIMTLAFVATTWVTSIKTYNATSDALRLNYENLDLVEQLGAVNANLREEVAERQRAEAKMKVLVEEVTAATQAKSQFLANMSHEIRTPMNGVIGMTDILSRTELDRRQRHQVAMIQKSAQTLLALLNDILDFSRIESGRIELEHAPFDIREVIADAVDVLADQAETKGLELAYEVAGTVDARVIGDQMRLRQILINLVGNAVKFTESGAVVLRVAAEGTNENGQRMIRFSVKDTGIGIDPKVRSRLFDPFRQADPSVTRRFGGSGLGLSISWHLVGLMGGILDCASEPGKGSEFFFSVPFDVDACHRLPEPGFTTDDAKRRVLVADESAVTLEILGNYLKSWKLDAVLAHSGADVRRSLEQYERQGQPIEAIVMSTMLSDMSGLQLASELYASPRFRDIRIVLLTPVNWSGDMQLAETRNILRTVNKPARQSQLFEALHAVTATRSPNSDAERANRPDHGNAGAGDASFDARVLLVEDNPVNQEVAAHYLTSFGCEVDIVDDGLAALSASGEATYDLIFMDCQMPVMDGLTATRRMREREQARGLPHIPIVALTASAFQGDRDQCLAAGMDDYVVKPFVPEDLSRALEKWLPAKRRPFAVEKQVAQDDVVGDSGRGGSNLEHEPLDQQQLAAMRARSPGLLLRLMALYREHTPPLVAKLDAARREGDCAALKSAAHALKSSSSNIAATHLADLCQLLEVKAQNKDIDGAVVLLERLAAEYGRVIAALHVEEQVSTESEPAPAG